MPIPSNPTPLAGVIGASADVLPIPAQDYTDPTQNGALNYATGWPAITSLPLEAGGKAPRREYFNALAQLLSSHIFFQQSGSVYPWSATLDYLSGAHVLGSDGKEYIAQKSNGPDVPDSSAVDPVGDESGTWLPAGSVYAPLATADTPGIVQPDNVTITIQNGIISATQSQNFALSWLGVPRPWRSTTLPANHCWANGDFVAFADWPELEQVYTSGGFEGMLMPWDADSGTQAGNLGKWRPDAAEPTGLYTPNHEGMFISCWVQGGDAQAGGYNAPGLPNITGTFGQWQSFGQDLVYTGAFAVQSQTVQAIGADVGGTGAVVVSLFDASKANSIYGASPAVMPPSINTPYIIYLGNPAKEAA